MEEFGKLVRGVVLVCTPILFFFDRHLPFSYLFSVDNRFFLLYWLFIPMLIWWIAENKLEISVKTRGKPPQEEPREVEKTTRKESKEPTFSETFSEKFREESAKPTPRGFWVFGILFTVPSFAFVVFPLLHGTDLYYWFEGVGLEFLFLFFPSAILGFLFGMGLAEFLQKRKNRKND